MYNRTDKKSGVSTLNGGVGVGVAGNGGPFTFIKNRNSMRKELKRQHSQNDDSGHSPSPGAGTLGRWLRDLRPGPRAPPPPPPPLEPLDRAHPVYHSEGKGLRRRKDRDRRRHSFNEQQPEAAQMTTPMTTPTSVPPTPSRSVLHSPNGRCPVPWQMARDVVASPRLMMAAQSTPNLQLHQQQHQQHQQQQPSSLQGPLHVSKGSIYSYLHNQSGLNFAPVVHPQQSWDQQLPNQQPWPGDAGSPPPAPPVRDSSSLKGVKYGPGHEKFPSWPMSPTVDPTAAPAGRGAPGGGSHRSKSWTDHTNYPKENGIPYTRPYMKRPNPSFSQQQLKTVMERCEKISPESYQPRDKHAPPRLYLPRMDREGKLLGDSDYMVPSPPERDIISTKPHLTQADLEEYAKSLSTSYRDPQLSKLELEEYAMSYQEPKPQAPPAHLTQAGLEEYQRSYDETLRPQHVHQPSYAQSEGYHSYVSSTDSTMATPFMDRLRRDSEAVRAVPGPQTAWHDDSDRAGRDSVVTTSSGSASSSETLKWHGSLSDVSVTSSSYAHHQGGSASRQLIAHSAKVQSPQRHNSESVLFPGTGTGSGWQTRVQQNNNHNKLRLFPVHTYTVQPDATGTRLLPVSPTSPQLSVAERISELEKQSRYSYLDPDKRHRVSDPTLKAIQKKALLSFYERHHSTNSSGRNQAWRSEPLLAQPASLTLPPCPQSPPPQPPPRPRANQTSRRASSASDYAANRREKAAPQTPVEPGSIKDGPRHQHSNSCGSLAMESMGPLVVGPTISVDDWVPERPPKKAHLRVAFPAPPAERLPSPDLPPPSPPAVLEDEVFAFDEPLPPPPPPEVNADWPANSEKTSPKGDGRHRQDVLKSQRSAENGAENGISHRKSPSSPAKSPTSPNKSPPSPIKSPNNRSVNHTFARTLSMKRPENDAQANCGVPPMKLTESNWSAFRYQTQKLMINGKIATSLPVHEAERIDNRNGSMLLPSKARLQRIPADKNGNGGPLSRSPPHAKTNQANESRLRSLNIRDSFRSQKARNALARSPPERQVSHEGVRRSPPESLRLEHEFNGQTGAKSTSPTEPELRSGNCGSNGNMSTSKASYLAYKRESHRESSLPNFEGSYKRTMSPSEVVLDNHSHTDCDRLTSVTVANFSLPAPVAVEKLRPSQNSPHQPVIKDRNIIIPTVINDRQPVKPSNDTLIQRVSIEEIKQFINVETVSLKVNTPSPTEASEEVNKLSDEIINYVPAVQAIEVETQCDMSKSESECDVDSSAVVLIPTRPSIPRPPVPTSLVLSAEPQSNSATSDASSQTEKEAVAVPLSSPVRPKLQEEIDCERLSLALANQLPATDKLQGILVPAVDLKRPADYVAGLFRMDIGQRPRGAGVASPTRPDLPPVTDVPKKGASPPPASPLPASSVYFTTSESKAKFLARFSTDMGQCQTEQLNGLRDNKDLHRKKEELMSRLDSKLVVLRAEHLELSEESRVNEQLGETVSSRVSFLARPHEAAKFRLHVEEVGKITSLLLGLSGRLARVENALIGLPEQHSEKKILESKRDKLKDQLEEAKKLKENIDRRSVFVSNILNKYFNFEEYADYDHFINMKSKLIIDSREIADKIKLGEEQLMALKDTLSSSDGS